MQAKLAVSPSHSILAPGQPVPALILKRQASRRVATGVLTLESLVEMETRSTAKAGIEPRSAALQAHTLPLGQRGGDQLGKDKLTLSGLTGFKSLSFVVCAALKKPQSDEFTVTVSFQSQQ